LFVPFSLDEGHVPIFVTAQISVSNSKFKPEQLHFNISWRN
jgi:hypothetical protein